MKNIALKFVLALVIVSTAAANNNTARVATFQRRIGNLISFELVSALGSEAKIEIEDQLGNIVTTRSFYSNSVNIPTEELKTGTYNYTIFNGDKASGGTFNIK
ncbi:hypothetical protein [Taibaiella soli]|nr:hypothetical protein [Taibaiella soli]